VEDTGGGGTASDTAVVAPKATRPRRGGAATAAGEDKHDGPAAREEEAGSQSRREEEPSGLEAEISKRTGAKKKKSSVKRGVTFPEDTGRRDSASRKSKAKSKRVGFADDTDEDDTEGTEKDAEDDTDDDTDGGKSADEDDGGKPAVSRWKGLKMKAGTSALRRRAKLNDEPFVFQANSSSRRKGAPESLTAARARWRDARDAVSGTLRQRPGDKKPGVKFGNTTEESFDDDGAENYRDGSYLSSTSRLASDPAVDKAFGSAAQGLPFAPFWNAATDNGSRGGPSGLSGPSGGPEGYTFPGAQPSTGGASSSHFGAHAGGGSGDTPWGRYGGSYGPRLRQGGPGSGPAGWDPAADGRFGPRFGAATPGSSDYTPESGSLYPGGSREARDDSRPREDFGENNFGGSSADRTGDDFSGYYSGGGSYYDGGDDTVSQGPAGPTGVIVGPTKSYRDAAMLDSNADDRPGDGDDGRVSEGTASVGGARDGGTDASNSGRDDGADGGPPSADAERAANDGGGAAADSATTRSDAGESTLVDFLLLRESSQFSDSYY